MFGVQSDDFILASYCGKSQSIQIPCSIPQRAIRTHWILGREVVIRIARLGRNQLGSIEDDFAIGVSLHNIVVRMGLAIANAVNRGRAGRVGVGPRALRAGFCVRLGVLAAALRVGSRTPAGGRLGAVGSSLLVHGALILSKTLA